MASVDSSESLDGKFSNGIIKTIAKDNALVLKEATIMAIEANGVFTSVVDDSDGPDYRITAELRALAQLPGDGLFSIKGVASILWTCTDTRSGEVIFDEKVRSEDNVSVGDAFAGAVRQVKAYEGAIRENIAQALAEISKAAAGAGA